MTAYPFILLLASYILGLIEERSSLSGRWFVVPILATLFGGWGWFWYDLVTWWLR